MGDDLIALLENSQSDEGLGLVATEALNFVRGSAADSWQSPGSGTPSLSIARMYSIRKTLARRGALVGLDESIASLSLRNVSVQLSLIETHRGVVSIWLADDQRMPVAIVIGKYIQSSAVDARGPARIRIHWLVSDRRPAVFVRTARFDDQDYDWRTSPPGLAVHLEGEADERGYQDGTAKFLNEKAPWELLTPGRRFKIFDGRLPFAEGVVLDFPYGENAVAIDAD